VGRELVRDVALDGGMAVVAIRAMEGAGDQHRKLSICVAHQSGWVTGRR
jgi:hypothetical protein